MYNKINNVITNHIASIYNKIYNQRKRRNRPIVYIETIRKMSEILKRMIWFTINDLLFIVELKGNTETVWINN